VNDSLERVGNLKIYVIVLYPSPHILIAVKLKRLIGFPTAVVMLPMTVLRRFDCGGSAYAKKFATDLRRWIILRLLGPNQSGILG